MMISNSLGHSDLGLHSINALQNDKGSTVPLPCVLKTAKQHNGGLCSEKRSAPTTGWTYL